jgi:hypothetical protein
VTIGLTPKLSREKADLTLKVDRVEGALVIPVMTQTLQLTKAGISHPFLPSWVGRFRK